MLLFILYLCYNIFIPQIFYTLINHYFYSNYMLYILYFYYINTIICYIYELFYVPLCVISYIIPVKYSICYTILAKYPICLCEISCMPLRNILYAYQNMLYFFDYNISIISFNILCITYPPMSTIFVLYI